MLSPMGDILKLIWWTVIGLFRSRASLEAEIQLEEFRRSDTHRVFRASAMNMWRAAVAIAKRNAALEAENFAFRLFRILHEARCNNTQSVKEKNDGTGCGALLWLLGVPLPIVLLLVLFWC
jgi:hypothetical protein